MILVLGENAAWQKTHHAAILIPGAVNRLTDSFGSAAGKGANVARVLAGAGHSVVLLTYAGGEVGDRYVQACRTDGIDTRVISVRGETRVCTTIIDETGDVTEIIEPPPRIDERSSREFRDQAVALLREASLLVISGTAIGGEPAGRYREFTEAAHGAGVEVILDSYREHGREALAAMPEILKINADELASLTGADTSRFEDRLAASRNLAATHGVRWIIITLGSEGAEGFGPDSWAKVSAPRVDAMNNIGSGDAFTAGVAMVVHARGSVASADIGEALARGTALGSANCLSIKPGEVDSAQAESIYQALSVASGNYDR